MFEPRSESPGYYVPAADATTQTIEEDFIFLDPTQDASTQTVDEDFVFISPTQEASTQTVEEDFVEFSIQEPSSQVTEDFEKAYSQVDVRSYQNVSMNVFSSEIQSSAYTQNENKKIAENLDFAAANLDKDAQRLEINSANISPFSFLDQSRVKKSNKIFKCTGCKNKTFKNISALRFHIRNICENCPYKCNKCEKKYGSKNNLQRHQKTHSETRSFACDKCTRTFKRKWHLETHQIDHTDLKLLKCRHCPSVFRYRYNLHKHERRHSEGSDLFKCGQCDYSAKLKSDLSRHKLKHSEKAI